jgi:FHA domain
MSNLDSLSIPTRYLHVVREQNPFMSDSLLADCNYEVEGIAAMIEPLLSAPQRCQFTSLYVQAVTTGRNTFLATNLVPGKLAQVTPIASSWLIGRSQACAIIAKHKTVSRCHAVIKHHLSGLWITDVGSSNGTWVNQRRLLPAEERLLGDGDVIRFGKLQVEFFLTRLFTESKSKNYFNVSP